MASVNYIAGMDMLLVGSRALMPDFPDGEQSGSDWDLWISGADPGHPLFKACTFIRDDAGDLCTAFDSGRRTYRLRLIPEGDARAGFISANQERPLLDNEEGWRIRIASLASLALIKRVYLYMPQTWHRHIHDYHRIIARIGREPGTDAEKQAYATLRACVLARLDAEPAGWTMRVSNEAFFGNFKYPWLRVFEHDDLHRATCYGEAPLYRKIKDDPSLAYVPFSGFKQLSHPDCIRLVREECYALALERVLIPAQDIGVSYDENRAFQHALRRICTTLARGWFRDFAIDHYPEISQYDRPFLQDFHRALAEGRLQRKSLSISDEDRRTWLQGYWRSMQCKDQRAAMPEPAHRRYLGESAVQAADAPETNIPLSLQGSQEQSSALGHAR